LTLRDSRTVKGIAKCRTRITPATHCQPPWLLRRYHGVSSGRFPDQMIRYCENAMYAHSMTKASSRFPKSWRCEGASTSRIGDVRASRTTARIASASPDTASPARNMSP
jgi:hypothetical protein